MRTKLLDEADGKRTFAIVLETGDEAMACLDAFAKTNNVGGAQITAIGAFSAAELSYFDWDSKDYHPIEVDEQVEVASLVGDVALDPEGVPTIHAHAVLSRRDGTVRAGHFSKGFVRPTLEILVTETPASLRKVKDPESGLALIDLGRSA